MDQQLATFKRFPDAIQAKELEELLQEKSIPYEYVEVSSGLDSSFGAQLSKEYVIKVLHQDFERATHIIDALAARWAEEVPDDYYLFTFTNDELLDLIRYKFEWSEFDFQLAKKLLKERGVVVNEGEIQKAHESQIATAAVPEQLDVSWIQTGYFAALLGGINIFKTVTILTFKKELPDGRTIYAYKEADRVHARIMIFISVTVWLVLFIVYLLRD